MSTTSARIEHANLTVADPQASAQLMQGLFGWHIRWEGPSMLGGYTIHVGSDDDYLALYASDEVKAAQPKFTKGVPLNHIGIVVDDLDAVEAKVVAAGLEPFSHDDYEPGRRFYFFDANGIEFEVVSYN
ncbi:VOC family protein [Sphingorhabdus sp. Alg239-R122]|uniref:VOC family protein n=1 Tax=Sphingorhabdus sp. Alg239-R122 TaxID=2305989 RepID=UPI0013DD2228|nr:VOC family protein [Sphingorhabdus sp. Alg239-R122]